MLHLDEQAIGPGKLKQLIANFIDYRPAIAGGCPVLNTAVDADGGNPVLRARVEKALRFWKTKLQKIVKEAAERGELRPRVDPKAVATLIVATLEGALMIGRIERNDGALRQVQAPLNRYIDDEVAASQ
jgi:TetR/AcrR family transcriptional regulator, transcriptional repressor for nem operon